jgi:hypothetical protein
MATAVVPLAVIICFWFRSLTALIFMTVEAVGANLKGSRDGQELEDNKGTQGGSAVTEVRYLVRNPEFIRQCIT